MFASCNRNVSASGTRSNISLIGLPSKMQVVIYMSCGQIRSPLLPLLFPSCGILNSFPFTGVGKNGSKQNKIWIVWGDYRCRFWRRWIAGQIDFFSASNSVLSFFFDLFFRLATSYLLGACVLVFNSILWIESKSGRNLPCITAFPDRRWLYRSIKFRTILSRSAFQCKQKCYSGNDKATHR